jgi:hypothetical protein
MRRWPLRTGRGCRRCAGSLQARLRPLHRQRPDPGVVRQQRPVRPNRGRNRTVKWALHMIGVTQTCGVGPGQAFVEGLLAGKTRTEALRLLCRRLCDMVLCALLADAHRQVGRAAPSVARAA